MITNQISDDRIAELADIIEKKTGKRPTMEEARAAGENLLQFVLVLDKIDRRVQKAAKETKEVKA